MNPFFEDLVSLIHKANYFRFWMWGWLKMINDDYENLYHGLVNKK